MSKTPLGIDLLSIPFEATTSFLRGTNNGPTAILDEINSIDCFDFYQDKNPLAGVSLKTIEVCRKDMTDPKALIESTYMAAMDSFGNQRFPIGLGGEHTVSIGLVKAALEMFQVGVVQLDAHSDLRSEYEGSPFSHACAMRKVVEMGCPALEIGIRAMCKDEALFVSSRNDISIVPGRDAARSTEWYGLIEYLPANIYLTVDLDAIDPVELPGVGTPEPGGMGYYAVVEFIEHLFSARNVVAADIVELRPCKDDKASIRLAARLLGIIAGLSIKRHEH